MQALQVGSVIIQRVAEQESAVLPFPALFSVAEEVVQSLLPRLDPRVLDDTGKMMRMSFQSFLLQAGGRRILVDTCNGNHKSRTGNPFGNELTTNYIEKLNLCGCRPEDVDVVLCTHLHSDHIGWNTRLDNGRWVPTFPNARYVMTRDDYDYVQSFSRAELPIPYDGFEDSVLPVVEAGLADFVSTEEVIGRDLDHGIWLEGGVGHTPGSVTIHVESKGVRALLCGDAFIHPIQIHQPAIAPAYEFDSKIALQTRCRLIDVLADSDTTLLAAHFCDPTAGRLRSESGGVQFKFLERSGASR